MADAASRVYGPALLTNVAATVYTVPNLTQFILRDIRAANTSGTAATIFLSIGTDAAGTRILAAVSIPANTTLSLALFLPVEQNEIIQAYSGTNNVIALTLSGVLVT